jgi:hypothetical protein
MAFFTVIRKLALVMVKSDDFDASNWQLDDEIGGIEDIVATKCSWCRIRKAFRGFSQTHGQACF